MILHEISNGKDTFCGGNTKFNSFEPLQFIQNFFKNSSSQNIDIHSNHSIDWLIIQSSRSYAIFFDMIIPLVLMFVPALFSFVLNLILWGWKLWRWYSTPNCQSSNRNSIDLSRALNSTASMRRCYTLDSSASLSSLTLIQLRQPRTKNSYHFIIIVLNIIDLPYYGFMMYNLYQNHTRASNYGQIDSRAEFFSKIERVARIFYIMGHSINIFIYMLFYKNFRQAAYQVN